MKKIITIWFLFLTALMYCGIVVSYLGCKFLAGNLGETFCTCEQVLISSQNINLENQSAGKELIKVSHKLEIAHFFNQFFSDHHIANPLPDDINSFPFLSVRMAPQGFISSLFRPPSISFS